MAASTNRKRTAAPAAMLALLCALAFAPASPSAEPNVCTTYSYSSADVPKPIPDPGTIESTLSVPTGYPIADVDVHVDVTHPFDSDLRLRLTSPANTTVTLAQTVGMWGDNFTGTVFDDEASSSIISNLPPFTGGFRPSDALSAFDGSSPGGTWKLEVKDERGRYAGSLSGWSLDVTTCSSSVPGNSSEVGAPDLPPLPTGVPSGAEALEGTLVTVANNTAVVNGTTSTVAGLQANPGPDGISLPEAIAATNNDPGTYTIRFAAGLSGSTISVNDTYRFSGGGVFVDGDIDGDGLPNITIVETNGFLPFEIISGGNRLHALTIQGCPFAVNLISEGNPTNTQPIARNVLSGLAVNVSGDGIISNTGGGPNVDVWTDNRIVGNTIDAHSGGIHVGATGKGDVVERTTVAGNRIHLSYAGDGEVTSDAISVDVGYDIGHDANHVSDALVAYNTETGPVGVGVAVRSGEVGGKSNVIDGVAVVGNRFEFTAPEGQRPGAAMSGRPSPAGQAPARERERAPSA